MAGRQLSVWAAPSSFAPYSREARSFFVDEGGTRVGGPTQRRVRRSLVYVGVTVITVCALLSLVEGGASTAIFVADIRALHRDNGLDGALDDTLVGWVGQPGFRVRDVFGAGAGLSHNLFGLRGPGPTSPELSAGKRRIICSGASFAYGLGVGDAETICAMLGRRLRGTETLKMSHPGHGIDQSFLWYQRDAERWPHQVHLLGFTWDDLERVMRRSYLGQGKPMLERRNGRLVAANVPVPRGSGSGFWSTVTTGASRLRLAQRFQGGSDPEAGREPDLIPADAWDVATGVFLESLTLSPGRHSALVLVYLPTSLERLPDAGNARRARLAEFARSQRLDFVDLTLDLRAVSPDSSAWFFITPNQPVKGVSGQYTAAGHAWVAERLASHLASTPGIAVALRIGVARAERVP